MAIGILYSFRTYGLLAALSYPIDQIRIARSERAEGFDKRFGTSTEGTLFPWQTDQNNFLADHESHPYEATPAWLMRQMLQALSVDFGAFVFVDLGAGKGRALMVASEFGFARLVGVETSPELCGEATLNLNRYLKKTGSDSSCSLIRMNAQHYEFEAAPLVVFLYNPFGKTTFEIVLSKLETSLRASPRPAYILYLNPRFERSLRTSRLFERVSTDGSWLRPWHRYVIYRNNVALTAAKETRASEPAAAELRKPA